MRSLSLLTAVFALAFPSQSFAASPVVGEWRTPASHGRVAIANCGTGICGYLLDSAEIAANPDTRDARNANRTLRTRQLKGAPLFENLRGGPPVWKGRVYNPVDGKTYAGSIAQVAPDRLELKGCAFAFFCRTETWDRIR